MLKIRLILEAKIRDDILLVLSEIFFLIPLKYLDLEMLISHF